MKHLSRYLTAEYCDFVGFSVIHVLRGSVATYVGAVECLHSVV